jgi:two-component system chemotaxis response regulator CheY
MPDVLIVDDSPIVRKIARRILENANLAIEEAPGGSEALALCAISMPDAILVDAGMPNVDGCEFIRRLRRMADGQSARVVFAASENTLSQLARAMHAGANDFLLKPFDRELLTAKFVKAS